MTIQRDVKRSCRIKKAHEEIADFNYANCLHCANYMICFISSLILIVFWHNFSSALKLMLACLSEAYESNMLLSVGITFWTNGTLSVYLLRQERSSTWIEMPHVTVLGWHVSTISISSTTSNGRKIRWAPSGAAWTIHTRSDQRTSYISIWPLMAELTASIENITYDGLLPWYTDSYLNTWHSRVSNIGFPWVRATLCSSFQASAADVASPPRLVWFMLSYKSELCQHLSHHLKGCSSK